MKLILLLAAPCIALAWSNAGSKDAQLVANLVSEEDMKACISQAGTFLTGSAKKDRAIERAMDHCALDKKVDDKNFVCPHYREILNDAFRREPTTRMFNAKSFCNVAESYVSELRSAAKVPNMGKGSGFKFELSKECMPAVAKSFHKGQKKLPAKAAPDFWYALCMNQDCAHFLPSRTRWCTHDHQPTHSQSVCESVRLFAHDEVTVNKGDLDPEQVCSIYDEFVEDTHINVEAYMHVVHGAKEHPVPSPANQQRALKSAQMKNEAGKNKLRDASGSPVKSGAADKARSNMIFAFVSLLGLCALHA